MSTKKICECLYCGYKWAIDNYASYGWAPDHLRKCLKCGDKTLKIREEKTVDYYPKEEEKKKGTSKW